MTLLSPAAETNERVARLLALLVVDQTRQVLPPTRRPPGPGMGLLMEDGSLRGGQGTEFFPEVQGTT